MGTHQPAHICRAAGLQHLGEELREAGPPLELKKGGVKKIRDHHAIGYFPQLQRGPEAISKGCQSTKAVSSSGGALLSTFDGAAGGGLPLADPP